MAQFGKARKLDFKEKLTGLFVSQDRVFLDLAQEKGISKAFEFYACLSLLYAFLLYLLDPIFQMILSGSVLLGLPDIGSGAVALLWVFLLAFLFVASAAVHLFARLAGARKPYSETFKAIAYGTGPGFLLGWIPFIGIFFFILPVYLYVKGLTVMQEISRIRAWFALLMPVLIVTVIIAIIAVAIVMSLLTSFSNPFSLFPSSGNMPWLYS